MLVFPPAIPPPCTLIEDLPPTFSIEVCTPSCLRLSSNGSIGLCSKDLPSKNTEGSAANAATGIMNRRVAPDSPQSIGSFAPFNGDAPSTVQQPFATFTFAPNALTARNVASVSSENRGPEIFEVPSDNEAAINILCVYDLEGGAQTSPFSFSVLLIVTVTNRLNHPGFLLVETGLQNFAIVTLQCRLHQVDFVIRNHRGHGWSFPTESSS